MKSIWNFTWFLSLKNKIPYSHSYQEMLDLLSTCFRAVFCIINNMNMKRRKRISVVLFFFMLFFCHCFLIQTIFWVVPWNLNNRLKYKGVGVIKLTLGKKTCFNLRVPVLLNSPQERAFSIFDVKRCQMLICMRMHITA